MFRINEMNNGILSGMKAMPQKDSTSDGENSFSMSRHQYMKSYSAADTTTTNIQKKWYGGSSVRDASKVLQSRVQSEVGNGSLNASKGKMSFTTVKDVNTTRDALRRVRHIGPAVPLSVGHVTKFPL